MHHGYCPLPNNSYFFTRQAKLVAKLRWDKNWISLFFSSLSFLLISCLCWMPNQMAECSYICNSSVCWVCSQICGQKRVYYWKGESIAHTHHSSNRSSFRRIAKKRIRNIIIIILNHFMMILLVTPTNLLMKCITGICLY